MNLPFEPACLPLLPSSLPHHNAGKALEMLRSVANDVLVWPQLPKLSFREQSLVQSTVRFPGLVTDAVGRRVYVDRDLAEREIDRLALAYLESDSTYAALTNDDAVGLSELLRQSETLRGARVVKGQILGPISLAAQLTDERQRPLLYDNVLFEALVQHLRLRVMWQEARLIEVADATIICLDEPFLDIVGLAFVPLDWDDVRVQIDEVLSGIVGCKAIMAGGAVDWSQVLRTSVELIIADVYEHSDALVKATDALAAFVDRDGIVGLGIVPSDADQLSRATPESLAARVTSLLNDANTAGITPERLARQALITTNAPLGHLEQATAEHALRLIGNVSTLLRVQYQLE